MPLAELYVDGVLNTDDILNGQVSGTEVDVYSAVDAATSKRKYIMSFYVEDVVVAVSINSYDMMQLEIVVNVNMVAKGKFVYVRQCLRMYVRVNVYV